MGGSRRRSHGRKLIFDPVHGPIAFDGAPLALLATPEFQRLWGIRQTGFAHLVFPGANHTRLEHSLGTFWVASRLAEQLGLDPDEVAPLGAGALLHDLGHGPFSHTLDGPMVEILGQGHEALSRRRIEGTDPDWPPERAEVPAVLERHGIAPKRVADLVDPRPGRRTGVIGELLHGPVDADRIDYLQRDAYYTGVAHGAIDVVRLVETVRSVRGRLAFAEKGRSAVEGFLVGRALMYSSVYYHKTVRAAEMMAQAAFERQRDYPDAARALFSATDGELLVRLRDAGPTSATLVRGLLERDLYKRAFGWRSVEARARTGWKKLARRPAERRALEDELAEEVRAPPGSVLIDLAGLEPRGLPESDWDHLGIVVGERPTFPFRAPSPWHTFVGRPPADWPVSVFADPRVAAAVGRKLARGRLRLPG